MAVGSALAGSYSNRGTLPGTDSQAAYDLMANDFPNQHGDEAQIVFAGVQGHQPAIDRYLARVAHVDGVLGVQPLLFSPDRSVAVARVTTANGDDDHPKDIAARVKELAGPVKGAGFTGTGAQACSGVALWAGAASENSAAAAKYFKCTDVPIPASFVLLASRIAANGCSRKAPVVTPVRLPAGRLCLVRQ